MKKSILVLILSLASVYFLQAQDSTNVEASSVTPPTEEEVTEEAMSDDDLFAMDFEPLKICGKGD